MRRVLSIVLLATACNPSFDGVSDRAWSQSEGAPDGQSAADYGVAVASVDREQPGATLVVAGADPAGLATLSYDDHGELTQVGVDVLELGFAALPVLAGAEDPIPGGDGVFAVGSESPPAILLYDARTGAQGPQLRLTIDADACGGGLEGLGGGMFFAPTGLGAVEDLDLIAVAGEDLLAFPDIGVAGAPTCLRCRLTDAGLRPTRALDLAAVDLGVAPGEELALTLADADDGPSSLVLIDAATLVAADGGDCPFAIAELLIPRIVGAQNEPDFGTRIAIGDVDDDGLSEIAVTAPSRSRLYVYRDVSTAAQGPTEVIAGPAGSVAFGADLIFGEFDSGDGEELAVADPDANPETVSGAGQVTIYGLQEDALEPRATLYDSAPQPGQEFGRALTIAEFIAGGEAADLLVVGARGEVFTYFRTMEDGEDPRQ